MSTKGGKIAAVSHIQPDPNSHADRCAQHGKCCIHIAVRDKLDFKPCESFKFASTEWIQLPGKLAKHNESQVGLFVD